MSISHIALTVNMVQYHITQESHQTKRNQMYLSSCLSHQMNLQIHPWSFLYNYLFVYILSITDRLFRCITKLFSVARHVRRLKLGSKPAQLYVRLTLVSNSSANKRTTFDLGIKKVLCINSSCSVYLFTFYT